MDVSNFEPEKPRKGNPPTLAERELLTRAVENPNEKVPDRKIDIKFEPPAEKKKTSKVKIFFGLLAAVGVAAFGARLIYHLLWFESTDDAFLRAHIHTISTRIPGYVSDVLVDDNYIVKKGQVLVKLDPSDYQLQVRAAEASFRHAHKDMGRMKPFMDESDAMDQKIFDEYQTKTVVNNTELNRAQLQYQYTNVTAPADGKIGRRNVETGDQIQSGQPLMALVEMHPWIEANFKEGQLAHLHLGQEVDVEVDAIPNQIFKGKIESIAPGSGSTFSLLPPDNATGNFTKIVQRIPVKIVFEEDSIRGFEDRLVPGMSSEITAKIE